MDTAVGSRFPATPAGTADPSAAPWPQLEPQSAGQMAVSLYAWCRDAHNEANGGKPETMALKP